MLDCPVSNGGGGCLTSLAYTYQWCSPPAGYAEAHTHRVGPEQPHAYRTGSGTGPLMRLWSRPWLAGMGLRPGNSNGDPVIIHQNSTEKVGKSEPKTSLPVIARVTIFTTVSGNIAKSKQNILIKCQRMQSDTSGIWSDIHRLISRGRKAFARNVPGRCHWHTSGRDCAGRARSPPAWWTFPSKWGRWAASPGCPCCSVSWYISSPVRRSSHGTTPWVGCVCFEGKDSTPKRYYSAKTLCLSPLKTIPTYPNDPYELPSPVGTAAWSSSGGVNAVFRSQYVKGCHAHLTIYANNTGNSSWCHPNTGRGGASLSRAARACSSLRGW